MSLPEEGMIDPTITGCFRNPEKNICQGPGTPVRDLSRRTALVELGMEERYLPNGSSNVPNAAHARRLP
jgi:hypothetical protein